MRPRFPRPNMRRVVVVVPSLFTLFNLFFGLWSMVLATRGEFYRAGWYIVFAAVLDALDGRFARLSNTGSRFGAELDSLVDVVSFGVAPAILMYMLAFGSAGQAEWIFCYFYVMAATIRLARFNVTQAGAAKRAFIGLPSPAAGILLATYYPFTQTEFYHRMLRDLPWHLLLQLLMIVLSMLMVSNVRYAALPRIGVRTGRGLLGLLIVLLVLGFGIWRHDIFLFPLGIAYMTYGVLRASFLALVSEPEDDEEAEIGGPIVITDAAAQTPFDDDPRSLSEGGAP
jgi:CDP-diacylglycerol---serine O-phosphatidyltransferase